MWIKLNIATEKCAELLYWYSAATAADTKEPGQGQISIQANQGLQWLAAAPRCQLRLNTAAATMSPSSLGPALPSRHNGKRRSRGRVSQETIHVWVRSVFDDQAGRRIVFSYPLVAHTDMPHKMKLGHSFMRWKRRFHEVITITEKAPTRTLS